jgi:hypothetical protein
MPSRLTRQSFARKFRRQSELWIRASKVFSRVHFVEETFAVELLQPAGIDDLFRFDVGRFGILFGDGPEVFEGGIGRLC